MRHALLVLCLLAAAGCATPTLQQRQDGWRLWQGSVRATCVVGAAKDAAMPDDVRRWCEDVTNRKETVK